MKQKTESQRLSDVSIKMKQKTETEWGKHHPKKTTAGSEERRRWRWQSFFFSSFSFLGLYLDLLNLPPTTLHSPSSKKKKKLFTLLPFDLILFPLSKFINFKLQLLLIPLLSFHKAAKQQRLALTRMWIKRHHKQMDKAKLARHSRASLFCLS